MYVCMYNVLISEASFVWAQHVTSTATKDVCMYIYMCIYVCVWICTHVRICMCTHLPKSISFAGHDLSYAQTNIFSGLMSLCMILCIYMYTYVHMYVYVYMHKPIYTYTYTYLPKSISFTRQDLSYTQTNIFSGLMSLCIILCVYIHIRTYVCIHIHIHTHTCTHTYTHLPKSISLTGHDLSYAQTNIFSGLMSLCMIPAACS
jgi:hypothetical protein